MSLARVNFSLLILVLGLSGLVWWDLQQSRPGPMPSLTDWQPAAVAGIHVQQAGRPALHLERHSPGWLMVAPKQLPANADQVEHLLEILAAPYRASYSLQELSEDQQRQMGLAKGGQNPVLTLVAADGVQTLRMQFGDLESQTNHRYLLLGERVYLIFDRFSYLMGMPADQWRAAPPSGQ